jgi:adenosylcobyric acid synthase
MARALMVLGTASHAGKSILTAALGRILSDDGFRVAPFKSQNMSLNSAATPDGREIGRAQALQAEACRVPARAEMNPVLIKPSSDCSSQIMLMGRVWGQVTAADYHLKRVEELFPTVLQAYDTLAREYDVIVLEGAGSPAEINLKEHDIVNMRMARAANAACLLAADIDRGGVFASLLGTVELLDPDERAMLRGFIVNKFRGDAGLLEPGIRMIEPRLGMPCAGVVPYLRDLGLDEEDGVAEPERGLARRVWRDLEDGPRRRLRIGVLAFPYLANFTDFDALAAEPSVSLAYVERPEEVRLADLLILPGSKQTLDDLHWLRHNGFEPEIAEFRGRAGVVGICGGMQMLGESIEDPGGAESGGVARGESGLGLLPLATVLRPEKVTRMVGGRIVNGAWLGGALTGCAFNGYEIHLGETVCLEGGAPFAEIVRGGEHDRRADGVATADGRVTGTYVHGLFTDDELRRRVIAAAREMCALDPAQRFVRVTDERDRRIDRLAAHVRSALNMDLIYECLGEKRRCQTRA